MIRAFYIIVILFVSIIGSGQKKPVYLGADLSYVNELEDCGAVYRYKDEPIDPYSLFAKKGTNLVRLRLWHSPDFSPYSNFQDVKKSMGRAKKQGMPVLLDFHYSDTWADPGRQNIPKAWQKITDLNILGDSVYQYTLNTLLKLGKSGLIPKMVQVGNETNSEILQPEGKPKESIDWKRNAFLLQRGIAGVREASARLGSTIEIMLHIAQPENALWWFQAASENGLKDYEWIGISWYPLWSSVKMDGLADAIKTLIRLYQKELMIVETSYPYTLENVDKANNILNENALLSQYPATPEGQRNYMIDLTQITLDAGGSGVIYWEPAWISSSCKTMWGDGSHWDNATFFDASNNNEALPAFDFFNRKIYFK